MRIQSFFIALFLFIISTVALSQTNLNHRDSVDVIHYRINLDITDFEKETLSGNTVLTIVPKFDNTSSIGLDLADFSVLDIHLYKNKIKKFTHHNEVVRINLPVSLGKKDTFDLKITYSGKPKQDKRWGGFFFKDGYAFHYGIGMHASPPNFGRAWFPCIDNFTDKATYDFHFTVKKNHTAVGCGVLQEVKEIDKNRKIFSWHLSDSIPTYLASVAVGEFTRIESVYQGVEREIPIVIYTPPGKLKEAKKSYRNVNQYMSAFEKLLGPYRWQKVGYVNLPYQSGAMEHATNIAIPTSRIDGSLYVEPLLIHELSHHWFGNLVTCQTEQDMWLNEGWASYAEALVLEEMYGKQRYKDYVRENHRKVLFSTHLYDKGYRPVYGNPHEYTYGSTVYDKGADICHTLRGYVGDSLFFMSLQHYFKEYTFGHINTAKFEQYLSQQTGMNLNDFFEGWIYTPGFPHFVVDSFTVLPQKDKFLVDVYLQQELKEKKNFIASNRIELGFMNKNRKIVNHLMKFSGQYGHQQFLLDFKPDFVLVDPEEKISDATCDTYETITEAGEIDFREVNLMIQPDEITDSIFLRPVCHWIQQQLSPELKEQGYRPTENYWVIDGIFPEKNNYIAEFYFIKDSQSNSQNIDLLYRPDKSSPWEVTNAKHYPSQYFFNHMTITQLKKGEYVVGIKD